MNRIIGFALMIGMATRAILAWWNLPQPRTSRSTSAVASLLTDRDLTKTFGSRTWHWGLYRRLIPDTTGGLVLGKFTRMG
jgi:hypothetical protein